MLKVFCAPARYLQGKNATAELGPQMNRLGLGGPALIIAGTSAIRLLTPTWDETFRQAGVAFNVRKFGGECSEAEIAAGIAEARATGTRVIVGAGGGKCLDAARAVAAALELPVVNCPTLAASDAPCSALSVIYSEAGDFKEYLFYRRNPDMVLVDTAVIASAPARYLVSGLGDALATWFEARTVIEAYQPNQLGGATTQAGGALARLCYDTLIADSADALAAVERQVVTPALERIVEANTLLSGLGFESGGLAIAHSVHNGLTIAPPTHQFLHGEKVAFGLVVQLAVEGRPANEMQDVLRFCNRVGLPTTLAQVGLADADAAMIRKIAERTVADGETAHHEPFPVTADLLADGIAAADEVGRSSWWNTSK
jgi:glycerol dehydrogenase